MRLRDYANELLPVETRRTRNILFGLIALVCFVYAGFVGVPTVQEGTIVISVPDRVRIVYGSLLLSPLLYCALSLTVLEYLLRPSFRYLAATGTEVGEVPASTNEQRPRSALDPHDTMRISHT